MQDASNGEEWKRIAEQIAKEPDSEKLALLVKELCDAFDLERKAGLRRLVLIKASEHRFRCESGGADYGGFRLSVTTFGQGASAVPELRQFL